MKSQILLRLFLCISLIPPLFAVTAQSAECTSFDLQVKVADTTAIVQLQKLHPEVRFTRIFPYSPKYEQRHRAHGLHLWYKAEINDSVTAKRIQRNLAKRKDVSHISRTVYVCNTISDSTSVLTSHKQGSQESSDQYCVNDPLYPRQWHYTNHYYPQSVDINLEKAWTLEQGSRNVIVAVMDHTIDVTHEDLRDNIWVNEAELNGEPGVDDDGDGYVDDVYGYDYAQLKGYSRQPADHGTHVAGTIAAVNNNGIGVAGIAGGDGKTTGVQIMGCHILREDGQSASTEDDIANAFVYAADHHAVIANNSWRHEESEILRTAIDYFMDKAGQFEGSPMRGGLVIFSADNENLENPSYRRFLSTLKKDNLIVVSSVSPTGDKSSYSNYGTWVDIAAPGGDSNLQGVLSTFIDNRYGYDEGTSMACPQVAGIAALVVSHFQSDTLTPAEVKRRILTSVSPVDKYNEGQPGWHKMGSGIADAYRALLTDSQEQPSTVSKVRFTHNTPQLVEMQWIMPDVDDQTIIDSCIVYLASNPISDIATAITRVAVSTAAYHSGDTITYRYQPSADNCRYYALQCKSRSGLLSPLFTGQRPVEKNRPVIYGDYLYNHFYCYQENINNHEQPKPHQLVYRVLAPEGMTVKYNIIDTGHAVCNEAFAKDTLRFSLAPAAEHPTGTYHANIVVASEEDASLADTLDIIYEVRGKLLRFGSFPQMRNGVSPNIIVTDIDGSFIINMRDYVEDPAGLGMYFEFDETKLIKPNDFYETTAKGRMLDDDRLEITYHLDGEEYFGKDYPMFDFTFTAFNAYNQKNKGTSFLIQVYYDATSSISDKPHSAAVGLYPNPAHDIIHLSSDQPVRAVNIYSVSGTLVGRYIRPADTIRIGHLPSGAYIVQMVTDKETIIRKIIKQ